MVVLFLATALTAFWLVLLFSAEQSDWRIAATNKVLGNREKVEKLRQKDEENAKKLDMYHGIMQKAMRIFVESDSSKKVNKLERESAEIQQGNLKSVGMLELPGYVLQRKYSALGMGTLHKESYIRCQELYGMKYADNHARELLARIYSYPIIGIAAALALGALIYGGGNKTAGAAVLLIGPILVLGLTYAQYDEIQDRLNKRREAISKQFPNVVSKLALLVTSGMIMDRAWRETAESQSAELYREMRLTAEELGNLVDPATAYTNFLNRCNTKETTKLASAIIQNQSKGNAEIGVLLKDMAHEAWQERRHTAKRDSEKANSKLMIPTMLLFVTILVMIMVPVALNFSSM